MKNKKGKKCKRPSNVAQCINILVNDMVKKNEQVLLDEYMDTVIFGTGILDVSKLKF